MTNKHQARHETSADLSTAETSAPLAVEASADLHDLSAEAKVERAIVASAEAVAKPSVEPPAPVVAAATWTSAWSGDAFAFWKDNAAAYVEFAKALSAAKTPNDILAMQTKFAGERLQAFFKHAQSLGGAPKSLFFAG